MDSTFETWAAMTNDYTIRFVWVMFHFIWQGNSVAIAAKVATMFSRKWVGVGQVLH